MALRFYAAPTTDLGIFGTAFVRALFTMSQMMVVVFSLLWF